MLLLWSPWAAAAVAPGDASLCSASIASASSGSQLPAGLMTAISFVESGRPDPLTGHVAAWPWTANIAGKGYFYDSKPEAIAAVEAAQSAGVQSIDVGCMQINLRAHPQAFASLDEAFDPLLNARYAKAFLLKLYHSSGDMQATIEAYHSSNLVVSKSYGRRVAAIWPSYAVYAVSSTRPGSAIGLPQEVRDSREVDPEHILTPEFRTELVKAAEFRRTRDAALLGGVIGTRPTLVMAIAQAAARQFRLPNSGGCLGREAGCARLSK